MKTKGKIQDIYPLTPMQEGMLFHALYEKGSSPYFVQTSYRLHGELNATYVKKSLNELLKRYDILRTVFIYEGRQRPLQVVLKEREIDFYYDDIRKIVGKDNLKIKDFVKQFKIKDKEHSFDLTKDVLMRVSILQLDDDEYEFIWSHPHIIMDGWCREVLFSDYFEIYESYIENRPYRLPEVKQFKTYIDWLENQDKNAAKNYWQKYLENYNEQTAVPLRKSSGNSDYKYSLEHTSLIFDKVQTRGLKELAAKNQATLNVLIQVTWAIILGKYNDKNDIVFGAVVSGRPSQLDGIESIIGIFINTVPVRIHYEEKTKFNQLLHQTQEKEINSEPYHHYPLVEIQSLSLLKRNLFDHIIICENFPIERQSEENNPGSTEREKLKVLNIESFVQTNYDFNLEINPGDQLKIIFVYNSGIFEKTSIEKLSDYFCEVFAQILNNEEIYISELTLLSPEEKKKILYQFNDNHAEYPPKTLHELFEDQLGITSDQVALVGPKLQFTNYKLQTNSKSQITNNKPISITYKKLNEKSNQLAHGLRSGGVGPDSIAAIMINRSIEMIIGLLGILKSGGAYLPLDPEYPGGRIHYMLADSEAKILITTRYLMEEGKVRRFEGKKILLEEVFETPGSSSSFPSTYQHLPSASAIAFSPLTSTLTSTCQAGSANLAYIIYTSGTTGRPKGVLIKHQSVVNTLLFRKEEYKMSGDVSLQLFSYSFDGFVTSFFTPLISGSRNILLTDDEVKNINSITEAIEKFNVTHFICIPPFYRVILEHLPQTSASRLKAITLAGDKLLPNILELTKQKCQHVEIVNEYGVTEGSVLSTLYRHQERDAEIKIGKPISNTAVYILDKGKKPQPIGVSGELCISGVGIAAGYLNNPQLTLEKFTRVCCRRKETIYQTGDFARWLPDGNIQLSGRIDHQVKIRGFRIELGEIESQLLHHDEIKEATALVRKDDAGDDYLCAYIAAQREFSTAELREYLKKELPDYSIPAYFIQVEKVPLTPNGKVDRKALQLYDTNLSPGVEYAKPENDTEELIASVWKEVLQIDNVGANDNFFDVGGHSLNIIRVNGHLKKIFQEDIPVVDMFRYPTIRSLAEYLDDKEPKKYISDEKIDRSISIMEKTTKLFLGD